jgi:hypothetical protein
MRRPTAEQLLLFKLILFFLAAALWVTGYFTKNDVPMYVAIALLSIGIALRIVRPREKRE